MNLISPRALVAALTLAASALLPVTASATPGTPTSAHPIDHLAGVSGVSAEKISYESTLMDGSPATVTGVIYEPSAAWSGPGERPTIVFAPGTRGAGDQCAPSNAAQSVGNVALGPANQVTLNMNYEYALYQYAAQQGVRVVTTDLVGLGTPGHHTYVNHIEEAHAVLDAARAALRHANAPADAPVGFAGYSQGGGAAAAAAEYAETYAPELNVKGTYAGAPPADLFEVMNAVDGSSIVHVLGYAINGYAERSPEFYNEIVTEMNPRGMHFLASAAHACIGDSIATWGFTRTSQLTKTGESFGELVRRKPAAAQMLAEQRLGQRALNAPMLVMNSPTDDLIPYEQARAMAGSYCSLGGAVQFDAADPVDVLPHSGANHAVGIINSVPRGVDYLIDRFKDVPAPSNCQAS